jgi:dTDP-4-amino-4,6-dideoxygalactose transaminase
MIPRFRPPMSMIDVLRAIPPGAGDDIAAFEKAFADVMGQGAAVAFPYGRTALMALLAALDVKGRDVICPAYTCVVVPNAIVHSGNRPVFIDSCADANACLVAARHAVTSATGALIATSIFGHPVNLDDIAAFREAYPGIPVIQDCAHSFICEWDGVPVHRHGTAAMFGLNISKTMSSVFGGMVTTDDEGLAGRLRSIRDAMITPATRTRAVRQIAYALAVGPAFWPPFFGITDRLRRSGVLDRFTRYYSEDKIDMPADHLVGMTGFQARVGLGQSGRLAGLIEARRRYDRFFRRELAGLPALAWIERPDGSSVSHCAARVERRDEVRAAAGRRGVELGYVIEYSVPDTLAYRRQAPQSPDCPVAREFARSTINLPTSPTFDADMARHVVKVMRDVLAGEPSVRPLPAPAAITAGPAPTADSARPG